MYARSFASSGGVMFSTLRIATCFTGMAGSNLEE
jgi:hypothetical protein